MGKDEKPTGRGGPGRGQGRKKLPLGKKRVLFPVKLRPEILAYLREQPEPAAQLIEAALIKQYEIKVDR